MTSQLSAASHTFTIEESTVVQLQNAMANSKLTAVDLVNYYTARIKQLDTHLNAFISVNKEALSTAAQLDKERAEGHVRGPLHGIPVVVKDNINTADMPTTGGCAALADLQPSHDAFVVSLLRASGAIVLGKANLHELACSGESVSSLGGQVHNPYNLDYTPGGSSGGTAAAIAANLVVCGLGSDTINSVRSPASACSIVGLRPTAGRVSRSGLMPVSLTQDVIGPMGRTVEDVAVLLEAISPDDPDDPMTARSAGQPFSQPTGQPIEEPTEEPTEEPDSNTQNSYWAMLNEDGLKGKRLGIISSLWGRQEHHMAVNKVIDDAIATMRSLGAQTVELAVHIDIEQMLSELSLNIWEGKLHLNQYFESLGDSAPVKTLKALLDTEKVHASIVPTLEKMEAVETPLGSQEYWQRLYPRRVELRQLLMRLFTRYRLDALVYPHQRQPVARIGEPQKERNGFLAAACSFPAITFPAGFVSVTDAELPVGIEMMARPFEEGKLLQMAYAYEQQTKIRRKPDLSSLERVASVRKTKEKTTARKQQDSQKKTKKTDEKPRSSKRDQSKKASKKSKE